MIVAMDGMPDRECCAQCTAGHGRCSDSAAWKSAVRTSAWPRAVAKIATYLVPAVQNEARTYEASQHSAYSAVTGVLVIGVRDKRLPRCEQAIELRLSRRGTVDVALRGNGAGAMCVVAGPQ
jgi:hypothetical protein